MQPRVMGTLPVGAYCSQVVINSLPSSLAKCHSSANKLHGLSVFHVTEAETACTR